MMAVMTLSTAFTELFSVPHPIALAPMGESAGGALAAAVSNGGGLGLLGGGPGRAGWLVDPVISKAIIEGRGADTERSTVLDIARGSRWPSKYPGRTLGHPFLDEWRGREGELAADPGARQAYQAGVARGDLPPLPVWCSEAIDLITGLPPAADLVATLAAQAEEALARAGR